MISIRPLFINSQEICNKRAFRILSAALIILLEMSLAAESVQKTTRQKWMDFKLALARSPSMQETRMV